MSNRSHISVEIAIRIALVVAVILVIAYAAGVFN